jgi:hypothetical protein
VAQGRWALAIDGGNGWQQHWWQWRMMIVFNGNGNVKQQGGDVYQ